VPVLRAKAWTCCFWMRVGRTAKRRQNASPRRNPQIRRMGCTNRRCYSAADARVKYDPPSFREPNRKRRRPISLKGKLHCVGQTDTGRVREHNEDMIAVDGELGLAVLADGMGGYNAGEVASGIAVKTVVNLVREALQLQ